MWAWRRGQGKVIIFNKGEGVMQLHEKKGKHGAPVTCGDWLFDNRLGLASGLRVRVRGLAAHSCPSSAASLLPTPVPRHTQEAYAHQPACARCAGENQPAHPGDICEMGVLL